MTDNSNIDNILNTYREETEDLWDQFMEGDDPDPQKYDDFLDNANSKAKQAIQQLLVEAYKKGYIDGGIAEITK